MAAVDAPVQPATDTAAVANDQRYRFTRKDYHAMVAAGVFTEDSRVELIRGDLETLSPINALHAGTLKRINRRLNALLGDRAVVGVQDPIVLAEDTEPQPDISVCRPREDDYTAGNPEADAIFWVIEVADSSLRYDRMVKLPLYAAAGVAEAWLLDLNTLTLEVHRQPSADGYRSLLRLKAGDQVSPLAFPDLTLEVADLLPPQNLAAS